MNKETSDDHSENSITGQSEGEDNGSAVQNKLRRRLQDNIESRNPTRNMNFDRRLKNNERRSNYDSDYKGPSRRLTIDRRVKNEDRRKVKKGSKIIY